MATTPVKVWTKLIGTSGNDQGLALTTGSDGSIYVTGTTSGNLDGETNNGGNDVFLTKYAAHGIRAWTKLIGTTSNNEFSGGVATGLDGSIYVTGYITGDLDGQINSGASDAFLTKYDAAGEQVWTRLLGSGFAEYSRAIATGSDGSVYIGGSTYGRLDGQVNSGRADGFLTKYSADGTKAWTRLVGNREGDEIAAIATGPDGSIYVAGHVVGHLAGQFNNSGTDAFLRKYDADGVTVWTTLLGNDMEVFARALTMSLDGSLYLTGTVRGDLDRQINVGAIDAFLTKYSVDGSKEWTKLLGSTTNDISSALAIGLDGSIYLAGTTPGDLDGQINSGLNDAFLTKYSVRGSKEWTQLTGSASYDIAEAVGTGDDGSIYVTGWTGGDLDGQINSGANDAFLIKYQVSSSTPTCPTSACVRQVGVLD